MADLRTTYLGLELTNPLVVAACSLCTKMENLHLCQRFGAGAVVLRSLFEEQILADRAHLDDALAVASEAHAEALDFFPPINHADAETICGSVNGPVQTCTFRSLAVSMR
jgi:dihydroorotate dehydrogenase (fumarate)